jgi:hypothetical protein
MRGRPLVSRRQNAPYFKRRIVTLPDDIFDEPDQILNPIENWPLGRQRDNHLVSSGHRIERQLRFPRWAIEDNIVVIVLEPL